MLSARQLDIVRTGRWDWLVGFIDTWFAAPLRAEDGAGFEEIAAAESRLGLRLPAALREWFELIGRRLIDIQDQPSTPATLREQDGGLVVWVENQGVWSIITRSAEDDPVCSTDVTTEEDALVGTWTVDRLTLALHSMLVSDTLVGVWSEALTGPLGKLKANVRGGAIQDTSQAGRDRLSTPTHRCRCLGRRPIPLHRAEPSRHSCAVTSTGAWASSGPPLPTTRSRVSRRSWTWTRPAASTHSC